MSVCQHIQAAATDSAIPFEVPRGTRVYKDDCMYNFDTPDNNANGLDVCLSCFQAFSRGDDTNYTSQHTHKTQHGLYLNILKKLKPVATESDGERQQKIAKLEIKDTKESDVYDILNTIYCLKCDLNYSLQESPLKIQNLVDSILKSNSSAREDEIKAWEQEIVPCEHSIEIAQTPYSEEIDLSKCKSCELKENLWICLHCGAMGCGREQFGSTLKGNSHALSHYETTGHSVAVKLGSLTEDSGDCYCYKCNDEVKVPELGNKLITYGIDITKSVKTEKSLIELNLDQNLNWDFKLDGANGEKLLPVFGPTFTGFQNLGNSCYLNSVVQALYSLASFNKHFEGKSFPDVKDPATDLLSQLIKIYHGLVSGKYSKPNPNLITSKGDDYQLGIKPSAFKNLIGENHAEFKTQRQQDAFEFLLYLLDKLDSEFGYTFTHDLKFLLGNKIVCSNCLHGKINYELVDNMGVPIEDEVIGFDEETKKKIYKETTLVNCFEEFHETQLIEGYKCDHCASDEAVALQTTGFKTYPKVLVVNAKRIKLENWVPVKVDVPIKLEQIIDLAPYKFEGFNENETEIKTDEASSSGPEFEPDQEALGMLLSMGFPEVRCIKGLYQTGNKNAEDAMNWIFAHMDDADIDAPFTPDAPVQQSSSNEPSEESIQNVVAMGFSTKLARKALILNSDVNAAVEWLFSNPDDDGNLDVESKPVINLGEEKEKLTKELLESAPGETVYKVKAVICHKGTSPHTGHYVVFIRKEVKGTEQWVLFNDEKVVACDENIEDIENNGYIYVFEKV